MRLGTTASVAGLADYVKAHWNPTPSPEVIRCIAALRVLGVSGESGNVAELAATFSPDVLSRLARAESLMSQEFEFWDRVMLFPPAR